MSSSDIDDLWQAAVSKYEEIVQDLDDAKSSKFCSRKSRKVKIIPTVRTLDDLNVAIENEHSGFTEFADKNKTLRKWVQRALLPKAKLGASSRLLLRLWVEHILKITLHSR